MSQGNRGGAFVVGAVLLAGAVGAWWWLTQRPDMTSAPVQPPPAIESTPPVEPVPAPPSHPIEDAIVDPPVAEAAPLPPLHESDALALEALLALLGAGEVPSWLVPEFVVQRAVATIDNLPRSKIASNVSVVRPAPGTLAIEGEGTVRTLSAANQQRYAPYVAAFEAADTDALVANYVRLYPLFQQAWRELGNADTYFNDRLVEVLDHLIAAPRVEPPIELVRPKVFWEFADPNLEAMSAGHKLMVRLGPAQADRVKAKLVALRERLTGVELPPAEAPSTG